MTEEQIKAIAEEYARPFFGDVAYFNMGYMEAPARDAYNSAYDIIKWLSTRYCIAEREKVEQEYVYACGRSDQGGYYDGKAEVLEDLFGDSMFNQNEE